ncbi:MAG: DUF3800 domain-containing protein [Candidatus Binataceae bacterium]|jgi:hypothetical protein
MFQAWFDDGGKDDVSPIYLLAGYSARVQVWKDFAAEWQNELVRSPKLKWLHAIEAYNLKGEFGFDKETGTPSEWVIAHGRGNRDARDRRLLNFVDIIVKHLRPETDSHGITWLISHREYDDFTARLAAVRTATIKDIEDLRTKARNPYFISFQKVLGQELKLRTAQAILTGRNEKTEILFDCGIDNPSNLEEAFDNFMQVLRLDDPRFLNHLQNAKPEYRDDKCNPPLQAADLLAWHIRRMCLEVSRGSTKYEDPVWLRLHDGNLIKYWDFRYEASDWDRILTRVRVKALLGLGIWLPPLR